MRCKRTGTNGMTREWIDYHCHLLPALDDGAVDLAESLEMARVLADFGYTTVYCTPHKIIGVYETSAERVVAAVALLQKKVDEQKINLRLRPGTEYYLDEYLANDLGRVLAVGNGPLLLVEAPMRVSGESVSVLTTEMARKGYIPLIAHPERCSAFSTGRSKKGFLSAAASFLRRREEAKPEPALLTKLKEKGCLFQGNLGSFAGVYGKEVQDRALHFLSLGTYHCLGSDAHNAADLASVLTKALRVLTEAVGEEGASRLLSGKDLPGG